MLPGGRIGRLIVGGTLSTKGDDVTTLDIEGALDLIEVRGAITAEGSASDAVRLTGEIAGLDRVEVRSKGGQAVVHV